MGGANVAADDLGCAIAVGPNGDICTAGSFYGGADFDPGTASFTLTSASSDQSNVFVSQLDAAGNFAWACRLGGTDRCYSYGVAVSPDGSIYATGSFYGTADFDPGPGTFNLSAGSSGYSDIFVSKLLPNHTPVDIGLSPAIIPEFSPSGTVVGQLSTSDPDADDAFNYELLDTAGGRFRLTGSQVRVADGSLLSRGLATSHNVTVRVCDYFGGAYVKTLTIDVGEAATRSSVGDRVWNDLNGNGLQDPGEPGVAAAVIEVFSTADGTIGNADDLSWGLTSTESSGEYALGGLAEGIDYYLLFHEPDGYSFAAKDAAQTNARDSDADAGGRTAVFRLAPGEDRADLDAGLVGASQDFGFAMQFGPGKASEASPPSTTVDAAGNVYVAGGFAGTSDFDPRPRAYYLTTSTGWEDVFVAKYSSGGALWWARRMGGTNADGAEDIAVSADGSVYTTGHFDGTADFDPGPGTFYLSSPGTSPAAFVAKLDCAGNLDWAWRIGGASDASGTSIVASPDGSIYVAGTFEFTADFDPGPGVFNLYQRRRFGRVHCQVQQRRRVDLGSSFGRSRLGFGVWHRFGRRWQRLCQRFVHVEGRLRSGAADILPLVGWRPLRLRYLHLQVGFDGASRLGSQHRRHGHRTCQRYCSGRRWLRLYCGGVRGHRGFRSQRRRVQSCHAGSWDTFVVELDAAGDFAWASGIGGNGRRPWLRHRRRP